MTNIVEEILKECQPTAIYSATCATILHSNDNYHLLKKNMMDLGLWTAEINEFDLESKKVVFEIR